MSTCLPVGGYFCQKNSEGATFDNNIGQGAIFEKKILRWQRDVRQPHQRPAAGQAVSL